MTPRQRPGRSKQNYRTPPEFLRAVERDFGVREWAVDLAATAKNSVSEHAYFGPGSPWGRDSLEQDWTAIEGDCWLNPPFARIAPWSSKCRLSRENIDMETLRGFPPPETSDLHALPLPPGAPRPASPCPPAMLRGQQSCPAPHARRIFLLVPAGTGSCWYDDDLFGTAHVVDLRPRITFVGCKDPYPKDLLLAIFSAVRGGTSTWKWR